MGLWELTGWMFAAVLKFVVTPSLMIARGLDWWQTVAVTSAGAGIGVAIFFRFGKWLFAAWAHVTERKGKVRRVFTPGRRRIVRMRRRFGVWGLLAVSGLISVPISSLLAAKYYQSDARMPWMLILAFVLWAVLLTTLSWWIRLGALSGLPVSA